MPWNQNPQLSRTGSQPSGRGDGVDFARKQQDHGNATWRGGPADAASRDKRQRESAAASHRGGRSGDGHVPARGACQFPHPFPVIPAQDLPVGNDRQTESPRRSSRFDGYRVRAQMPDAFGGAGVAPTPGDRNGGGGHDPGRGASKRGGKPPPWRCPPGSRKERNRAGYGNPNQRFFVNRAEKARNRRGRKASPGAGARPIRGIPRSPRPSPNSESGGAGHGYGEQRQSPFRAQGQVTVHQGSVSFGRRRVLVPIHEHLPGTPPPVPERAVHNHPQATGPQIEAVQNGTVFPAAGRKTGGRSRAAEGKHGPANRQRDRQGPPAAPKPARRRQRQGNARTPRDEPATRRRFKKHKPEDAERGRRGRQQPTPRAPVRASITLRPIDPPAPHRANRKGNQRRDDGGRLVRIVQAQRPSDLFAGVEVHHASSSGGGSGSHGKKAGRLRAS